MYICVCKAVTDREIRQAVDDGAATLRQVRSRLLVGRCCGRCVDAVREVIDEHRSTAQIGECLPA